MYVQPGRIENGATTQVPETFRAYQKPTVIGIVE